MSRTSRGQLPLSKTYLRGEEDLEAWYVWPVSWHDELDIDLPGQANTVSIDAAAHTVLLDSGQEVAYQKLLIAVECATGCSRSWVPTCPAFATCVRWQNPMRSSSRPGRASTRCSWGWA